MGTTTVLTTALKREHLTLWMEVRPNLQGEYVLTLKDEDSTTLLCHIVEEGNKVLLLDPSESRHKVVFEWYPYDLPLDTLEAHPQVASAKHQHSRRNKLPTTQVLRPPAAKLDLGCWDRYSLCSHQGQPAMCYKWQRFSHPQAQCEYAAKCGLSCLSHPTEESIAHHRTNKVTTARYPNCGKSHHAWNIQCPEKCHRLPWPP